MLSKTEKKILLIWLGAVAVDQLLGFAYREGHRDGSANYRKYLSVLEEQVENAR